MKIWQLFAVVSGSIIAIVMALEYLSGIIRARVQ